MRATFATVLVLAAAPLAAQDGAFVVRLGDDTLLVEQYRLSGNTLAGDQVFRAARVTTVRHFTATLDRRGGVVRYELAGRPAATPDARPQTLRVSFDADTAVIELVIGDSSRSQRLVIPGGAIPFVNQSYALLELVTRQARRMGRAPYVAQLLPLASLAPVAATVTGGACDSATIRWRSSSTRAPPTGSRASRWCAARAPCTASTRRALAPEAPSSGSS